MRVKPSLIKELCIKELCIKELAVGGEDYIEGAGAGKEFAGERDV